MGPFDGLSNYAKQGEPDSSNVLGGGFSSVRDGDANKWRTIDETNRHLNRDPDLMYTGRSS